MKRRLKEFKVGDHLIVTEDPIKARIREIFSD